MIVLVTGGRDYAGAGLVEALDALGRGNIDWCILGDCPKGADAIATRWARAIDVRIGLDAEPSPDGLPCVSHVIHSAAWIFRGKRAGPERNQRMVDSALEKSAEQAPYASPIVCLAAPGGAGTADCVRRARAAGIEVREVG